MRRWIRANGTPRGAAGAIAKARAISRSRAANLIRVCQLPDDVLDSMCAGLLAPKTGEQLLRLTGTPVRLRELADRAIAERWSVDQVEREVDAILGMRRASTNDEASGVDFEGKSPDPNVAALERELSAALGQKVRVVGPGASGYLAVQYFNLEELDGVIERIRGTAP